jgi:hypothetical protein
VITNHGEIGRVGDTVAGTALAAFVLCYARVKLSIVALLVVLFALPASAQERGHHFWHSKKFLAAFSIDAAASIADYAESQHAFSIGYREGDPLFGTGRPGLGQMTAVGLPLTFAISYASFRASESQSKYVRAFAPLPVAYDVANHLRWAIWSATAPPFRK